MVPRDNRPDSSPFIIGFATSTSVFNLKLPTALVPLAEALRPLTALCPLSKVVARQ